MENTFAERRMRLKKEMVIAEERLKDNLGKMSLFNYIPSIGKDVMPAAVTTMVKDPIDSVLGMDFVSRRLLPDKHWLRRTLRHANTIIKGYRVLKS